MQPLNILSLGAGAIGTYIGGSLALAGHSVTFVEQPRVAEILTERGLRLDLGLDPRRQAKPEFTLHPPAIKITDSLAQAFAQTRFDVMLFALKSFDTPAALTTLKPLYAANQLNLPILCLQNGVENEPAIAAALGENNVIYGTVTSAVGRSGPGSITLEKLRGVGIAAGNPLSARLAQALDEALLNAKSYPRPADMKWSKMLTNLLANPTSAILDMTPAEIFAHPGLYRLEIEQLRECLAVMQAQGIGVVDLPGTPVRALALATRLPLWMSKPFISKAAGAGRGAKMPSFHIDLHNGRKQSEITYLHGAIVRAGEKLGVPTPVNKLLTQTLLGLTNGTIPLTQFLHQPEKLLNQL